MAYKGVRYLVTRHEVKKRGHEDGTGPSADPPVAQPEPSQYEEHLIHIAQAELAELAEEWSRKDKALLADYCTSNEVLVRAKEELDLGKDDHEEAIEEFENAQLTFDQLPHPRMSRTVFWVLFAIFVIGEFVANYYVFQVFGVGKLETVMIALAVCVGLPTAGHIIGAGLRRRQVERRTIWLLALGGFICVATIVVLAVLREQFFKFFVGKLDAFSLNEFQMVMLFVVLNAFFVAVTTLLAYEAGHDDPATHNRARHQLRRARGRLKREARDLEGAASEFAKASSRNNSARAAREHEHEILLNKARADIEQAMAMVRLYRASNMAARRDKSIPAAFKADPAIAMPPAFVNTYALDWDCTSKISSSGRSGPKDQA